MKKTLKRSIQTLLLASLLLSLVSCWQRDKFPADLNILERTLQEPEQTLISKEAFSVDQGEVPYQIEPLYRYDLTGLVVSYRHHKGNSGLHRRWNDHLNVSDICVLWSSNTQGIDLNAIHFWNGQFTCILETRDADAWSRFNVNRISNNHLITEDSYIREEIQSVQIGDQIRIRGWLSNYSNADGFRRGTSTMREDAGNGACETVYVRNFEVLQSMNTVWRTLLDLSVFSLIGCCLVWVGAVLRGVL